MSQTIQEAISASAITLMDTVSSKMSDTDPANQTKEEYMEEVSLLLREIVMFGMRYFYVGLVLGLNNVAVGAAAWEAQKEQNPAFTKATEELAENISIAP